MSKTSAKNRYTQLMEWLPTLNRQRKKRSKRSNSRMDYYESKRKV